MKIYDAFMFFNELDLLEIRMEILNDYVDYFVISESNRTFSGLDKPLYYEENKEKFSKFHHKIIHRIFTDTPERSYDLHQLKKTGNSKDDLLFNSIIESASTNMHLGLHEHQWMREYTQREFVKRCLLDCEDNDIIFLSDLDEIPNTEIVKNIEKLVPENTFAHLEMKMSQYYINVRKDEKWLGTNVARYSYVKGIESNYMRANKSEGVRISNAGNHLTFLGGVDKIKTKISSYGHLEYANEHIFNNLADRISNFQDIFDRGGTYYKVELDESFPEYIRNNVEKYPEFFL